MLVVLFPMTIIVLDSLKKRNQKIYTHSVAWDNPYKDPPNNLPRVLFSFESLEHRPDAKRARKIDQDIAISGQDYTVRHGYYPQKSENHISAFWYFIHNYHASLSVHSSFPF